MFPGRFPNGPESMWNFGWNPQSMGFPGQFCGGDRMNQQSQAQTQAQISALQQQNAMLNQHLHSQAQSHIQHLQQLLPFHQPPQAVQPPSVSFQFTPQPSAPQAPDPPAPVANPATQFGTTTSLNDWTDEEHSWIQSSSNGGKDPRAPSPLHSNTHSTSHYASTPYQSSSTTVRTPTTSTTFLSQISLPPSSLFISKTWQTSNLRPPQSPSSTFNSTPKALIATSICLQRCVHSPTGVPTTRSSTFNHSSISISTTSRSPRYDRTAPSTTRILFHNANPPSCTLVEKSTRHHLHCHSGPILLPRTVIQRPVAVMGNVEGLLKKPSFITSIQMDWRHTTLSSPRHSTWFCHQTTHGIFLHPYRSTTSQAEETCPFWGRPLHGLSQCPFRTYAHQPTGRIQRGMDPRSQVRPAPPRAYASSVRSSNWHETTTNKDSGDHGVQPCCCNITKGGLSNSSWDYQESSPPPVQHKSSPWVWFGEALHHPSTFHQHACTHPSTSRFQSLPNATPLQNSPKPHLGASRDDDRNLTGNSAWR